MTATKALPRARNDALRALLRRVLVERFDNDQGTLAAAIGIRQGTLSDVLNSKKGVGGKTLSGLAQLVPEAFTIKDTAQVQALDLSRIASSVSQGAREPVGVNLLDLARQAARMMASALGIPPLEAWAEFFDPLPDRPNGRPWDLESMVAAGSDARRRRLEPPAAELADTYRGQLPDLELAGSRSIQAIKDKSRKGRSERPNLRGKR
jgi:hypothetical protein